MSLIIIATTDVITDSSRLLLSFASSRGYKQPRVIKSITYNFTAEEHDVR